MEENNQFAIQEVSEHGDMKNPLISNYQQNHKKSKPKLLIFICAVFACIVIFIITNNKGSAKMDATSKDMPWFEISSEGEICLKPEYRGANIGNSYMSDNGLKAKGSMFDKLPQNLVIPNSFDGVAVRSIRECAFLTVNLKSVVIGDNVIIIGDLAFSNADINEISFGNNIEEIGKNAFNLCNNLTNVTLPESLKILGESSFAACKGLVTLQIPDKIETIGKSAFVSCSNLKNIKFGNGVKVIGEAAFSNCPSLVNIEIPDSIEIIEEGAFIACSNLKTVEIGNSENCQITTIANAAFLNCPLLESITIYSKESNFQSSEIWCPDKTEIQWMLKGSSEELDKFSTIDKAVVGDIVYFGSFEQDDNLDNGKEAIAWHVLAIENGNALLISKGILCPQAYNVAPYDITWETCALRKWLNGDFLNSSFIYSERTKITPVKLENKNNPYTGSLGGNDTNDMVFLLSYDEAEKYYTNNEDRKAQATNYSKSQGLRNSSWWLRSTGKNQCSACIVNESGIINYNYEYANFVVQVGVRPAIWINLSDTISTHDSNDDKLTIDAKAMVSELAYFGSYEQDNNLNNGKEKIAWRVIDSKNETVLLISEKILDAKPYNIEEMEVTWETCSIRKWLNDDFMNKTFTDTEMNAIQSTTVINHNNSEYGTAGGNNTIDKVFLLSSEEKEKYYSSDMASTAKGTDFSINNGLYVVTSGRGHGNSGWWLRSPGIQQQYACDVSGADGYIDYTSVHDHINVSNIGVRPALWLNLQSKNLEIVSTQGGIVINIG